MTQSEYEAATILAFDPEAQVLPGQLASEQSAPLDCQLPGHALSVRDWKHLARASHPATSPIDDMSRLAAFLGERSRMDAAELGIGARVRIRARPRVGGDRYAGREGLIVKRHFAGFYVKLDMSARERSQKTELVETAYLELSSPSVDG